MNIAIVLASGKGTRMTNHRVPKAFIDVGGKPLLYYSLSTFQNCSLIDQIVLAVPKEYLKTASKYRDIYGLNKLAHVIVGGATRQESVRLALDYIKAFPEDIVLIHDSARPLVSERIIFSNIQIASKTGAVATVMPASDTIIVSKNGDVVDDVPDRSKCFIEQTPASFRFDVIHRAHQEALKDHINDISDDVKLVKRLGVEVVMVLGERKNFKVTNEEDLEYLLTLLGK